jgi:hypothetical protein
MMIEKRFMGGEAIFERSQQTNNRKGGETA